jgi:hypothetical protein
VPHLEAPKRGPKGSPTRPLSCTNVVEAQSDLDGGIQPNTAPHGDAWPSRLICPFAMGRFNLRVFQRGYLPLVASRRVV